MKRARHRIAILAAVLLTPMAVNADTIDFTEIGATGLVPSTVINLSNVILTSFGDDMFIGAPGQFGEANNLGIVCASPVGSGNCEEDLQIDFLSVVTNLMLSSFGVTPVADSVTITGFLGATNVGSLVVSTQGTFDLSSWGALDRLYFADNSTAAGIGWGDFSFDTAAVPEPAPLALLGLGLALIGLARRRGRA